MRAQDEAICAYSGRLAPVVTLDERRRIQCGCNRLIRVNRATGRIARHWVLPLYREAVAEAAGPRACWARRCAGRMIARGLCWRHYRQVLRLGLGRQPAPAAGGGRRRQSEEAS